VQLRFETRTLVESFHDICISRKAGRRERIMLTRLHGVSLIFTEEKKAANPP
jgi:hypothetical protein